MEIRRRDGWRGLAALTLGVAVVSVVLQYVLLIDATATTVGPALGTLRFISYFTILANLMVSAVTAAVLFGTAPALSWICRAEAKGAVALYIGVTGAIYFAILRHLWQPQGAQWWADTGLHYATPVLYLAWWLLGVRHVGLPWRSFLVWLAFPAAYLLWVFVRGEWVREYPYPFIDVGQLG